MTVTASTVYEDSTQVLFEGNIGVNILSNTVKVCTFDCPYCYLGPTEIKVNQIKSDIEYVDIDSLKDSLKLKLEEKVALGAAPSAIEISGNGDPSLHPNLKEILEHICEIRNQSSPKSRILFLTNGGNLDNKKVISALQLVDEILVKLDAGDDKHFSIASKPLIRVNVSRIISSCKKFDNISLQSFFFTGDKGNSSDEAIEEWIEVVGMIKPKMVYITTGQPDSFPSGVRAVEEDLLYVIMTKLKRRTELNAEVIF